MRIRMYNVGFGDCFCIRDRKSSLLVDFGAANSKIEGRPRREVFDVIISDLTLSAKKSASDTFSSGHVSGLLYMMRYRRDAYEFEKIYLPDVFFQSGNEIHTGASAPCGCDKKGQPSRKTCQPFLPLQKLFAPEG